MAWPIHCPDCDSYRFTYRSDRSGNVRRYGCKECGAVYVATIKDMRSKSAVSEPTNLNSEDLYWEKVVIDE